MSTELKAEVERLYAANNRLARQLAGMSAKLEEGRRELLAIGWDAAAEQVRTEYGKDITATALINANPYRKPVIDLSGAMFCKLGDDI
jgi:hypothetical protein